MENDVSCLEQYRTYMEQTRNQVMKNGDAFYLLWDEQIKEAFGLKFFDSMSRYISYDGGVVLSNTEYENMSSGLKSFFDKRAVRRNGLIILRGYDYYINDPTMHINIGLKDQNVLWKKFLEKWNSYTFPCTQDFLGKKTSFQDWIGTLAMLEYIFSDLTSLRWFVYMTNGNQKLAGESVARCIDKYTDKVGQCIALMLRFEFETAAYVIDSTLNSIFADYILRDFLNSASECVILNKPCIRAVREGDSLAKIYAAYLLKLIPFCKEKRTHRLLIFSNAFGAMNAGVIIKHLFAIEVSVFAVNINYSTHRYYRHIFGAGNEKVITLTEEYINPDDYDAVVIIDDTVWTASSYKKIIESLKKESLKNNNIYLLPLSLDCNLLAYSTKEFGTYQEMFDTSLSVNTLANEIGNTLPAFASSWDRERKFNKWYEKKMDPYFTEVMDGCDLLMQYLWYTYFDEGINLNIAEKE